MDTIDFPLRHVRFPDPAGQLQDEQRIGDLIRELGDNYDRYHDYLATELESRGSELPNPQAFRGRYEDYCREGAYTTELVVAESMLRYFAALRGAPGMVERAPLIDELHRLVSAHPSVEQRYARTGSRQAARWSPPPAPLGMPL